MTARSTVAFGLSVMPEPAFAQAALPLFEQGLVEVVEWSFDMGWGPQGEPGWLASLVDEYAADGALVGHGVSYSLLGVEGRHDLWLERLAAEVSRRRYRWISEHIGFVGAGRFSFSAPLPLPFSDEVMALGRRRLAEMAAVVSCPVGVENLATCLGVSDAERQGQLLEGLLAPVHGFMVLDLHNLWCQSMNTGISCHDLLAALPVHRVRELHVSGGSWSQPSGSDRTIRRDTHDDVVPEQVHALLALALTRCPNVEVVIYERLGHTLGAPEQQEAYRQDVRRVYEATRDVGATEDFPPAVALSSCESATGGRDLRRYQSTLLETLNTGVDGETMRAALGDALPAWRDDVERFDPDLLEVAAQLTRTWGRLHPDPGSE